MTHSFPTRRSSDRGVGLEARILAGGVVGPLDVEEQRHQRLGHEAAAEDAEVPGLVGAAAVGVQRLHGGRLVLVRVLRIVKAGLCPLRPAAAMPAGPHPGTSQAAWKVRAAARQALIFWADFSPGASSTPAAPSPARHSEARPVGKA